MPGEFSFWSLVRTDPSIAAPADDQLPFDPKKNIRKEIELICRIDTEPVCHIQCCCCTLGLRDAGRIGMEIPGRWENKHESFCNMRGCQL